MADEAGSHFAIRVWSTQQGLASRNSKYRRSVGPLALRLYDLSKMKVQMIAKLWSLESTRRYSIVKVHGAVMML
jgi:hypothetical protein